MPLGVPLLLLVNDDKDSDDDDRMVLPLLACVALLGVEEVDVTASVSAISGAPDRRINDVELMICASRGSDRANSSTPYRDLPSNNPCAADF